MTENRSPFAGTRFEYENDTEHLYFLPPKLFAPLEEAEPTYIVGTRGSGKTTLLKALNWRERLRNRSLRTQLGENPFGRKYVGVYLRCPHVQLGCFDKWLRDIEEVVAAEIVSLELDLAWLKALLEGVAGLVAKGIIRNSAQEEREFVQTLSQNAKVRQCISTSQKPFPKTILDVAEIFDATRLILERAAKLQMSPLETSAVFPVDQVGALGREISALLHPFCDLHEADGQHWHFKVCLDESECLSSLALKVVNTAVRLSEWPVFFVVSFVRTPSDIVSTVVPGLTHQRADKRIIELDRMSDDEFRQFAEGVCTVRVNRVVNEPKRRIVLTDTLGEISINRLLTSILEESVRPESKALLKQAKKLESTEFYRDAIQPEDGDSTETDRADTLPIYQAYLVEKLALELPGPTDPKWFRRRQESRELRKRMVAAYLSICSEIGTDVRYASAEMVFQLSDTCMRDFLFQMHEIFIEAGRPPEAFVSSEVSWKIQDAALKRASKLKFDSISNRLTKAPNESAKLIEGFCRLTAMLQSRSKSTQHLASSERGLFEIDLTDLPEKLPDQFLMITEAAEAGFLKITSSEIARLQFRIHTSLAPHFGCSYRGAYYPSRISLNDIRKFSESKTTAAMKDSVGAIVTRIESGDDANQFHLKGVV